MHTRTVIAVLMVVAAGVFVAGTRAERAVETRTAAPAESGATHSESGESVEAHHDEARAPETFLGVNPDSSGAVAAGVAVSLFLAAVALYVRKRAALLVVGAGALVFGALDLREAAHQTSASHGWFLAAALVLAGLHLCVAALAGWNARRSLVT